MRKRRIKSWRFMAMSFLCLGLAFVIFWKFAVSRTSLELWQTSVSEAKEERENLFLGYHYVRDGKAPGVNTAPAQLRQHLEFLIDKGYEILTCGEIARRMANNIPLPRKCASLSFDYGLRDHYMNVLPILREFGVKATFFVITCAFAEEVPPVIGLQILIERLGAKRMEFEILPKMLAGTPYSTLLDPARYDIHDAKSGEAPEARRIKWVFNHFLPQSFKRDLIARMFSEYLGENAQEKIISEWFMSTEEIREMDRCGMEISPHSHTHPPFDISGLSEVKWEMVESKNCLARILGKAPITFGYPFGGKYQQSIKTLALKHYTSSWNYLPGKIKIMPVPPYELGDMPRLNANNLKLP